jgi:hypothetical protein
MSDPGEVGLPLVATLSSALLDPVLCAGPFARGDNQPPSSGLDASGSTSPWPEPDRSVQLIWCAPSTTVSERLPGLWQQVQQHDPERAGCIDVVVDLDVLGRLVAADIEAVPLSELLAGVGETEAAAAAAELPGLAAEVAVPALADLLERLLAAAASTD